MKFQIKLVNDLVGKKYTLVTSDEVEFTSLELNYNNTLYCINFEDEVIVRIDNVPIYED